MLKDGLSSKCNLLFKQFATKLDKHAALPNTAHVLLRIHCAGIQMEPAPFIGAWRAKDQKIWWVFSKLACNIISGLWLRKVIASF
jgi:hypothetical protein